MARVLFYFGLVCLAFSPGLVYFGYEMFNFGLVALHLARVLFIFARVLFNCGLVCPAFSPGVVYLGEGPVLFWLGLPCI